MIQFGLIGHPLSHSYSQKYFTKKFKEKKLKGYIYNLFDLKKIVYFPSLIKHTSNLVGLNVTMPYKQSIIPYLDKLNPYAQKIGVVNTIKIDRKKKLIGYNTDYIGFYETLKEWGPTSWKKTKALILGTGGSAITVGKVLTDLSIQHHYVSRSTGKSHWSYEAIYAQPRVLLDYTLIVNCTPLGMFPQVETMPFLPYSILGPKHWLFDLVYNPYPTKFLQQGIQQGANIHGGLAMLYRQAEQAWKIWL